MKTTIDQVIFSRVVDHEGLVHFAADWDQQVRYSRELNRNVRKTLERQAKAEFGYYSGITGQSVYVQPA